MTIGVCVSVGESSQQLQQQPQAFAATMALELVTIPQTETPKTTNASSNRRMVIVRRAL